MRLFTYIMNKIIMYEMENSMLTMKIGNVSLSMAEIIYFCLNRAQVNVTFGDW